MSTTATNTSSFGKLHTKATIEVVDGSDSPTSTLHATQVNKLKINCLLKLKCFLPRVDFFNLSKTATFALCI